MIKGYLELKKQIRKKIIAGLYKTGKPIPSRTAIMRQYNCARTTVDKAINSLIEDGTLEGKKGSGTYVVDKDRIKRTKRYIYIILHRKTEIYETDLYPFLNCLKENFSKPGDLRFITIDELQMKPDYYIKNGLSFIFCQLNLKNLDILNELKRENCNILLINRQDPIFDYITNDSTTSLINALKPYSGQKAAIVAEPACLERPFREDYTSAFFKAVTFCNLSTKKEWFIECDVNNLGDATKAMMKMFSATNKPDIVFLFAYTIPYVLSTMHINDLTPGKDIKLIHFDAMPETINTPGITILQQNFLEMGFEALKWLDIIYLTEKKEQKFQKLIPAIQVKH